MKKILIASILFLSFLGLTSCSEEKIGLYEDKDNIYFSPAVFPSIKFENKDVATDSTGFSFAFEKASLDKKVYLIPIRVQGKLSDKDRKVKVVVDPLSTAVQGTHFTLPESIVMRAGKAIDTIAVTIYKTPDLKSNTRTLILNLEGNEFFDTKMQSKVTNVLTQKTMSYVQFKLTFNNILIMPKGWVEYYLGKYSAKKFLLMCDLLNLDPSVFSMTYGSNPLTAGDYLYYGVFMRRYLQDQKASGNTIYEDDGTEMIFP